MPSTRILRALVATGFMCATLASTPVVSDATITFTDIGAGLQAVAYSGVDWGDYDSDGDLDIVLAGENVSDHYSRIYRNDGGGFTDIGASLIQNTRPSQSVVRRSV